MALTWLCVRREQGSLGGAPYAGREVQAIKTTKVALMKAIQYFDFIFRFLEGAVRAYSKPKSDPGAAGGIRAAMQLCASQTSV
jgi:hypothetical protein